MRLIAYNLRAMIIDFFY